MATLRDESLMPGDRLLPFAVEDIPKVTPTKTKNGVIVECKMGMYCWTCQHSTYHTVGKGHVICSECKERTRM